MRCWLLATVMVWHSAIKEKIRNKYKITYWEILGMIEYYTKHPYTKKEREDLIKNITLIDLNIPITNP
jgi:hypothetical protein